MDKANILCLATTNKKAINNVYNIAFGNQITLNELLNLLKEKLSMFDSKIPINS